MTKAKISATSYDVTSSFGPFQWTENVDNRLSLRFPRVIIKEEIWSTLKTSSKAVYPCLLKFVNKETGSAFPCLRTLSIVSGVSEKTAGDGVRGLDGLPGFKRDRYITKRGHTAHTYNIQEPPPDNNHTIWIQHSFINGGNWSQLTPTAKAIFPVLKYFSWWDERQYLDLEKLGSSIDKFDLINLYTSRQYDFMDAEDEVICRFAGITTRSLQGAYGSLSDHHFISPLRIAGRKVWEVYISPPKFYRRDWLNKRLPKR
jgi:hypothetical protein